MERLLRTTSQSRGHSRIFQFLTTQVMVQWVRDWYQVGPGSLGSFHPWDPGFLKEQHSRPG